MPTKTKTKRTTGPHSTKRHAKHHKVSKHYLKVYWPYVPIMLIIAVGLFFGTPERRPDTGVLAYATEMGTDQLLESTNKQRQQNGKPALQLNPALSKAAQSKAQDMAARNYWAHITPDGKAPWYFVEQAGYKYTKAGENLAYGFATSKDTVTGWMNSQTHKDNMLDDAFSEVGFGFVNASDFNDSGKETIVVAMYGEPKQASDILPAQPSNDSSASNAPFTTLSAAEPAGHSVSWLQNITGGAPWITFVIGVLTGSLLLFVVIRHGLAFKRALVHGEQFVLHHPVLDIAVVSIVMIGYVVSQSTGFIR